VPNIRSSIPSAAGYAGRQAINAPIQGTAADIIKRAMLSMEPALSEAKLDARMILQVHDELVFEVREADAEAVAAVVKRVMETACEPTHTLTVPLVVDVAFGASWGDAH
jgi:DNA polymerase-1